MAVCPGATANMGVDAQFQAVQSIGAHGPRPDLVRAKGIHAGSCVCSHGHCVHARSSRVFVQSAANGHSIHADCHRLRSPPTTAAISAQVDRPRVAEAAQVSVAATTYVRTALAVASSSNDCDLMFSMASIRNGIGYAATLQ
jgi:hypothetical protein